MDFLEEIDSYYWINNEKLVLIGNGTVGDILTINYDESNNIVSLINGEFTYALNDYSSYLK